MLNVGPFFFLSGKFCKWKRQYFEGQEVWLNSYDKSMGRIPWWGINSENVWVKSMLLHSIVPGVIGHFVLTGHMVKNLAYWMAKERGILHWDIKNKGKSGLTGWNSFVFKSTTFFCHPVWWILYHVNS